MNSKTLTMFEAAEMYVEYQMTANLWFQKRNDAGDNAIFEARAEWYAYQAHTFFHQVPEKFRAKAMQIGIETYHRQYKAGRLNVTMRIPLITQFS